MSGPTPKPGRPARESPAGRDLVAEQAHLAAWWAIRPGGKPSGREVARRIDVSASSFRNYVDGRIRPSVLQLENMQRVLSAYGYDPPTDHYKFL